MQPELAMAILKKCERGDSNPHGSPHWILNPARLPNSATLAPIHSCLLPFELRLAFLEEGAHTLLEILRAAGDREEVLL